MKPIKALVVGGTGYLGRHLVKYLGEIGYEVYISGSKPLMIPNYYQINFEDRSTFENLNGEKFEIVLILAAKLNSLGKINLNHSDLRLNTIDYANFLEYLKENNTTQKIIYTSSMTVYSEQNPSPVKEDDVIAPVNTYGLSKYLAENITSFFCHRNEIKGAILRLPGIYGGDRQSGLIYNIIKKAINHETVEVNTQGLIYWETIYVHDLCKMIISFLKNYDWENDIDIFNLSYGEETDVLETVHFIKENLQSESIIKEESKKGYRQFYLSNKKAKKFIHLNSSYHSSLISYLNTFEL
ncbi:MAG: UDP-glucose 4-epimerase [Saprospiraceae bacterium]|nr:MAG: UDP-glucose 4-epimerase [Saprospiraceae bacterium]